MSNATEDIDRLYREGVAAIRAGDKVTGRERLMRVVDLNSFHEQGWLWLSAAVETDEDRIICLENVLTINPANEAARRGLEKLGVVPPPLPASQIPSQPTPRPVDSEPPVTTQALPPSPPELSTPLGHAAPDAIDSDLEAVLTGVPRKITDKEQPARREDESWRARLYDPAYTVSTASIAPPIEPPPRRTLPDLFSVWADMLILNVHGGFEDEVKYGGFGHILVNVVAASILQVIAVGILSLMLFVLPGGRFQPPLIRSAAEMLHRAADAGLPETMVEGTSTYDVLFGALSRFGVPDPITEASGVLERVGAGTQEAASRVARSVGVLAASYVILAIPLTFTGQMYYSLILNMVSGWLRGQGDVAKTLHAMTIAQVVAQIMQLPVMLFLAFLPVSLTLTVLALLGIYQLLVAATALGAVQKFGLLISIGTLVMSGFVGDMFAGLLVFGLASLISLL